jgi:2-keto-4-pentenoate hydratase
MNEQIAQSFIDARRARGEVPASPVPADIAECFAISAAQRIALGQTVGGWKVGQTPDDTPIAAPMYASGFLAAGATFRMKPGRPMIPEIEIALRLARDIPSRPERAYTREELLDAASELVLGIELIERRIPPNADFRLNFADDLGNIGYVVGPAIKDFRALDLASLRCVFWIGGELKSDRVGGHPKGDPMIPLVRWANTQGDRHGGMKAGQIVTLGSLTPMIEMTHAAPLAARLEGFGDIALDVTF